MLQLPVPEHGPDHPANVEPLEATAVNVIAAPLVKVAEQIVGQLIPAGLLETLPDPGPFVTSVTSIVDAFAADTQSKNALNTTPQVQRVFE